MSSAYFSNYNLFSREHIFVGLTNFLSCVGALSSITTGLLGLLLLEEWDGILRAVADKFEITSTKKNMIFAQSWTLTMKVVKDDDSNRERQIITTEGSIRELVPNNNKTRVLVNQNLQNLKLNLHLHGWKFCSYAGRVFENFSLEILLVLICNNNGSNELEL